MRAGSQPVAVVPVQDYIVYINFFLSHTVYLLYRLTIIVFLTFMDVCLRITSNFGEFWSEWWVAHCYTSLSGAFILIGDLASLLTDLQ
jgi:hypothetical protein